MAIGQTRKGKTTMLHVPRPLEAQARRWIDDFQKANALLEALDEQGRLRLEEAKTKARAASSSAKKKGKTGKKSAGKASPGAILHQKRSDHSHATTNLRGQDFQPPPTVEAAGA